MKATLELKEISSSLKAVQVKEKFGALRFYTSVAANDVEAKIIAEAEKASACTCEECGQPGKARGGGWIRTLCDQCESGQQVK
jgi:indole-3-glycerol phosphate synthase